MGSGRRSREGVTVGTRHHVARERKRRERSGETGYNEAVDAYRIQPGYLVGRPFGLLCEPCDELLPVDQSAPTLGELLDVAARHWAAQHTRGGDHQ